MELRIYTKKQLEKSKPFVSFGRTGLVLLNKAAAKILSLKAGDCIEFADNPQTPEDWYVRKAKKSAFKLRPNTDNSLVCNAQDVCKSIKEATDYPLTKTVQYSMMEQPAENGWHLLLTSKAKVI